MVRVTVRGLIGPSFLAGGLTPLRPATPARPTTKLSRCGRKPGGRPRSGATPAGSMGWERTATRTPAAREDFARVLLEGWARCNTKTAGPGMALLNELAELFLEA